MESSCRVTKRFFIIVSTVLINIVFFISKAFTVNEVSAIDIENKSISTINITTENLVEPTCEYISAPENCWGATIINNEYVNCKIEYNNSNEKNNFVDENGKIKIRGNTSAYKDKKPYKLKLGSKQSFGTDGNSKKWILLKSGTDLKFLFSNYVAEYCGSEWQPRFEYVNLNVNGDYKGCYVLAESVENISKSLNFSDSGFLVENDAYWWNADQFFKVSNQKYQLGFTFKEPDYDKLTEEQVEEIKLKVNEGISTIVNDDDRLYLDYINAQSFAAWFLAKDYFCNYDAGGANMYWYSLGNDELLNLGPMWDYDSDYYGDIDTWSFIHEKYGDINYGSYLFCKDSFKKIYRNQYEKTKNICDNLNSYINEYLGIYGASLQDCWNKDAERWNTVAGSVDDEKNNLLKWYSKRNQWIENATSEWSLDFSDYNKAMKKANDYDKALYDNYDVLDLALNVDVYDIDFTQDELNSVTKDIYAAIEKLVLKNNNSETTTMMSTTITTTNVPTQSTTTATSTESTITLTTANTTESTSINISDYTISSMTSSSETTTTANMNIASDEELCDWAAKHYQHKTGITDIDAKITNVSDDKYEITLTDKDGNVVDVYWIDPITGIGTNSDKETVNLPQTGSNSMINWLIFIGGLVLIGFGLFVVKSSGIIRRREDVQ